MRRQFSGTATESEKNASNVNVNNNVNNNNEEKARTVPITIEMPPMDDVGGDESHCFVETWHKRPGDSIERDDVLCDISTPDFVFGMQIDDEQAGVMGEIHAPEGVKVPDGAPICTIYHQEDDDGGGSSDETADE